MKHGGDVVMSVSKTHEGRLAAAQNPTAGTDTTTLSPLTAGAGA